MNNGVLYLFCKMRMHVIHSSLSNESHHVRRRSLRCCNICDITAEAEEKNITSSVYDCTVEDVEYHNISIVTHSHHLVVVITLP